MGLISRSGQLWLSTGIAAGSLLLSPLAAQQLAPKLLPAPFPQPQTDDPEPIHKEVLLDADGRFVVAVIAPNGSLVAGARMTFTAAAKVPASSQVWETTAKGLVVISGLKPGVYHVAIAAAQGSYQGLLLIRSADPGDKTRQHLVAFTLDCGCTSEVLEGLTCEPTCGVGPQTGRLAAPLLIGAAATATALSLTLGGEQEGPVIPVASP